MNYVLTENHNIRHDLRELLRIAFKDEEYEFIDSLEGYDNRGRLIVSSYKDGYVDTLYMEEAREVSRFREDLASIELHIDSEKKKLNTAVKKSLISAMGLGDKLPWGILTGIRPMKIVHNLLDQGIGLSEISRVLREEYLVWDKKASLLMDIGTRQRPYLASTKDKYSVYVSIPFCPTTCLYCSFPSLNIRAYEDQVNKYVDTLIYEIEEVLGHLPKSKLNTVYIGGGTPTSIDKKLLERIILKLREVLGDNIREFTVEAGRPDTLDYDYLKMLKKNKIDRISINPQTMREETLKTIGRFHTVDQVVEIYRMAKELKIDSINMDMIVGLPGETLGDIKYSLERLVDLGPENITVHTLAVKTGSRFKETIDSYSLNTEEDMRNIIDYIHSYSRERGYEPYYLYRQKHSIGNLENVGYSRDGRDCLYNISMMEERESIIALGFGGVSKFVLDKGTIKRVPNFKGYEDYMGRVDELISKKLDLIKKLRL